MFCCRASSYMVRCTQSMHSYLVCVRLLCNDNVVTDSPPSLSPLLTSTPFPSILLSVSSLHPLPPPPSPPPFLPLYSLLPSSLSTPSFPLPFALPPSLPLHSPLFLPSSLLLGSPLLPLFSSPPPPLLCRGWEQLEVTCNPRKDNNVLWNVEGNVNDKCTYAP